MPHSSDCWIARASANSRFSMRTGTSQPKFIVLRGSSKTCGAPRRYVSHSTRLAQFVFCPDRDEADTEARAAGESWSGSENSFCLPDAVTGTALFCHSDSCNQIKVPEIS